MLYFPLRSLPCIVPPHILRRLLENQDPTVREAALNTLLTTSHLAGERSIRAQLGAVSPPDASRRTIYDCRHKRVLTSAVLARTEDGKASSDASVNRAFDGIGHTRDFYRQVLQRNSIDDRGMRLNGYVHFSQKYQNAYWDGQQMVFGDGDGKIFTDFTKSLDVIGHELTHGVTEHTANLEYHQQSGALNESISDVFGSLVKQWTNKQKADQADWLIGAEVFTPGVGGDALRSMKAPGTAYENATLGKDPQPSHMSHYAESPDTEDGDWGGVHINSGIPNKAFYLTAAGIGGFAWEAPGHIWYESLKASTTKTQFQDFANTTYGKAGQLYGSNSAQQKAVLAAWDEVGISVSKGTGSDMSKQADSLEELTSHLESLSEQVQALAQDVALLKSRQ